MLKPTPALRPLLLAAAGLFLLLVGLRLHGFSLPVWHVILDRSPAPEVWLGQARSVRADDWAVQLPLILAQRAHDPPFPRINRDIGLGQNMLLPMTAPVAHPLTLFRPTVWGFFLGGDLGLAWMWWSQVLGLFVVWLLVLRVVSGGRLGLACAGSALLAASPFFQFWSFNPAPVAIYLGLAVLGTLQLLRSPRRGRILAGGLLLGWAGVAFALVFYPPYQIPLGYLYLVLAGGLLAAHRGDPPLRTRGRARLIGLGLAVLVVGVAAALLVLHAGDALVRMAGTTYPGGRVASGGGQPLWHWLNSNLATTLQVDDFGALGNICTAASFWLSFPVLALAAAWRLFFRDDRDPLLLGLAAYCMLMLIYGELGFPEPLARLTLFSQVPAPRVLLGLGLADALLLVRFLSRERRGEGWRTAALLAASFSLLLALCARALHAELPDTRLVWLAPAVVANGWVTFGLLQRWRPTALVASLAAAVALTTLWFNPLVRGGTDYLRHNPLSERILELDREAGGGSVWLTYGHPNRPNLFRMLGVKALNGVQPIPQLELWGQLDPSGEERPAYNRWAHVGVGLPGADGRRFRVARNPDGFSVALDPQGEALRRLGVTHLLAQVELPIFERRFARYPALFESGGNRLYALPLEAGPAAP